MLSGFMGQYSNNCSLELILTFGARDYYYYWHLELPIHGDNKTRADFGRIYYGFEFSLDNYHP